MSPVPVRFISNIFRLLLLQQIFAARPKDNGSMTLLPGERLAEVEEAHIELILQHVSNNVTEAAALLGIIPRTLRNRIAVLQTRRRLETPADHRLRLTEAGAIRGHSMAAAKGVGA